MSFNATVDLRLAPSVRLLKIGSTLHVVPLALLPFAMQPGWPMLLLVAAIGGSWLALRRNPALGFGPKALTRLVWHAEGAFSVHDAAGREQPARLLGESLRHPILLVLRFRLGDGSTRSRLIGGDEAPPEQLRRLRARLSVWRDPDPETSPP